MGLPWWFPFRFLKEQWFYTIPYPGASFAGQTIVVTGANSGLGLEAARHFMRLGAEKVILAVRNVEKGEMARENIIKSLPGDCEGVIEVWSLDLCSFESVQQFAARAQKLPRLDILLSNAAIHALHWDMAEGHEQTITTNVISTFLLALLLLPKLKETAQKYNKKTRLTFVVSETHFASTLEERHDPSGSIFETLRDKDKWDRFGRYNVSKLLEVLIVRQISQEETDALYPIITNCVNPGLCWSELAREFPPWKGVVLWLMGSRTAEEGSRTLVHSVSCEDSHGCYLSVAEKQDPSPFVMSVEGRAAQKRVWAELKAILENISVGVTGNI